MVNKKGYLRTVESIIAIVIILSIVYAVLPKPMFDNNSIPNIVKSSQDAAIKDISFDTELKLCIIDDNCQDKSKKIGDVLERNKPIGFSYAFKICDNPVCTCVKNDTECSIPLPAPEKPKDANGIMTETFISSTASDTRHKIVRFWMWKTNV